MVSPARTFILFAILATRILKAPPIPGLVDGMGEGETIGVGVGTGVGVAEAPGTGVSVGLGNTDAPGVAVGLLEGKAEASASVKLTRQSGTGLPSNALCFVGAVGATGFWD
jgi:hypothetical protein